jgi:hypothetical protein
VKKPSFISSKIGKKTVIKHKKVVYLKMQYIQGTQSNQLQMHSLEDKIRTKNPVRFIDAFVEHNSLESVGFTVQSKVRVIRVSIVKSFLKSICMII